MRLVVLREIPDDVELQRQWNTLVAQLDQPAVFYTYEWALAVQRAYKSLRQPLVFLGYDGERLCGVTALFSDDPRKQASFLCATTGDYCDFISPPECRAEFLAAVLAELKRAGTNSMVFANLPADSNSVAAIHAAASNCGLYLFSRTGYICSQIAFDRLELRKDGRPKAPARKRFQRIHTALGPVSVEHRRKWEEVQPLLQEFVRAHIGRFLETGRISILTDPNRQEFLNELGRLLAVSQWLVFSRLFVQNKPAAWHYGFEFHDSWFWYQPTFDGTLEKYSPGSCLLHKVVVDAMDDPKLKVVDLGLGAEGYKTHFANASRETLYLELHRSFLKHWTSIARYRLASAARSSPRLENFGEKVRQIIRHAQARLRESRAPKTLAWVARRILGAIWSRSQVNFYRRESSRDDSKNAPGTQVMGMSLEHLVDAAIIYHGDEETLAYLLRAAKRLHGGQADGFVLIDAAGSPLHIAWVAPFAGFFCAEVNSKLEASPESVLLFDCWTPRAMRGRGYYEQTISTIGEIMQARGKEPWIFGASNNVASLKGIERAGFLLQHRLVRKHRFAWQKVTREVPAENARSTVEPSPRV